MKRECPTCGGQLEPSKVRVAVAGYPIGSYEGYRCVKCSEEFLLERSLDSAHEDVVRAGLFGAMTRKAAVNSPVLVPFVSRLESTTSGLSDSAVVGLLFSTDASNTGSREQDIACHRIS